MSTRLLRRLLEENLDASIRHLDPPDDENYEVEEEEKPRSTSFGLLSNIESESDSESESDADSKNVMHRPSYARPGDDRKDVLVSDKEKNELFDSILLEFKDVMQNDPKCSTSSTSQNCSNVFLDGIDVRDFDLDVTMRNMMNGCLNHDGKKKRRKRVQKLFCQPRAEWGKKPETFIGGGLGMEAKTNIEDGPWPYSDSTWTRNRNVKFFRILRSVEYTNLVNKYNALVSNSGDINTLAMFIADYPYVLESLFQFAMFFFSISENDKAVNVLKRCLWIIECVSLPSLFDFENSETMNVIDFDFQENQVLFHVLFRYAQASCTLGCVSTSCAVGRLLLSLDPLRDPCGILLVLDYYALATMREKDLDFLISLVDSGFKIGHNSDGGTCHISEMPNWAFSYAFALFRKLKSVGVYMNMEDQDIPKKYQKSLQSLCEAIFAYPWVPRLLLEKNNVDFNSRSLEMDWKPILDVLGKRQGSKDTFRGSKIISIFVDRSHKLWDGYEVLKWLFEACKFVSEQSFSHEQLNLESNKILRKYEKIDPIDFSDSFLQIPQDLNPLDPRLADAALHYTSNRRRILRFNERNVNDIEFDLEGYQLGNRGISNTVLLGTPRWEMTVIEPSRPLLEVFWRSILPWSRVDGV